MSAKKAVPLFGSAKTAGMSKCACDKGTGGTGAIGVLGVPGLPGVPGVQGIQEVPGPLSIPGSLGVPGLLRILGVLRVQGTLRPKGVSPASLAVVQDLDRSPVVRGSALQTMGYKARASSRKLPSCTA